ncbi:hypothetical protein VNO80_07143 [Phaseolus coccineus]|uniref:Uncharacterized protein n=1 Tax=Phaseolus coccineus TaxID=3886 RepID=A0AAN9RJM2_PHACN
MHNNDEEKEFTYTALLAPRTWFHEVEGRGRRISNGMNLKANPTTGGRDDGGSIKLVALKDGGSGDTLGVQRD